MRSLSLALHFTRRDLKNRYLGSFSGGAWTLIQPLVQLAVYAFVFVQVFKSRVPGLDAPGYVPFLVVALWPWVAFSEALQRAVTAIQEHAGLISKVNVPVGVLVAAPVFASFCIHGLGYVAILVVLKILGTPIQLLGLPAAIAGYLTLGALALGLALLLAAVQVFVRDIASALPQLLMLGMYLSPVFYSRQMLPEAYRPWLALNPYTAIAEHLRYVLLGTPAPAPALYAWALAAAALALLVGWLTFRRLEPHFEDFL